MKIRTGLDKLVANKSLQQKYPGNIAYLCHGASVNAHLEHGLYLMQRIFGGRLKAVFSPQHGLFAEEQDNMIESGHYVHSYFKVPVYSLYSETRAPTAEMLTGIDYLFVDLQDIGSRVYTYVYTMLLSMEVCGKQGLEVVILDRPNPLNGLVIEGNLLDNAFTSFIGLYPLPMRHGMTMGEIALMAIRFWKIDCDVTILEMEGWKRGMYFEETGLPWVFPSPNMPHLATNVVYSGMVLLEGTNLSEGRGTTRPFEVFGHPELDPYVLLNILERALDSAGLSGFVLRPLYFKPTFDKYADVLCGGYQLHVTDRLAFRPWRTGQILCRELYRLLDGHFQWRPPPFEYDYERWPIDLLNGTDQLRLWVERQGSLEELEAIEGEGRKEFLRMYRPEKTLQLKNKS